MQPPASGETLLTDLCAICHLNPLKYTCPRCGVHTCSLPCVKKHKQWAQCSGIRDPTEYRKRADLATPSSIDKDFNFITKVERTLQRADDTVADRRIDLTPARPERPDAKSRLKQETEDGGIHIIKAPKALSRSKLNRTHWAGNSKCIIWTLEWIAQDGSKTISHTHDTQTVLEAYMEVFASRYKHLKRRREAMKAKMGQPVAPGNKARKMSNTPYSKATDLPARDESAADRQLSEGSCIQNEQVAEEEKSPAPANDVQTDVDLLTTNVAANEGPKTSHRDEPTFDDLYFYLHRPNTEARYKCLTPIAHDSTLRDVLKGKTLIEFPTLYIKAESPEQLQSPFISDAEYTKRHGVDIPINISSTLAPAGESADVTQQDDEDAEEGEIKSEAVPTVATLDEVTVLEVLAKDLEGS